MPSMPTFRFVTASAKYGSRSLSVEIEEHRTCEEAANLVPGARIELATPAFSGRRSTTELPRQWIAAQYFKERAALSQI